MTIKARYNIYLNTAATGIIHAADCVLEEQQHSLNRVGFRYRPEYLNHPKAFAIDPSQLPLRSSEFVMQCNGGMPGFLDDYLPDAWGRKVLVRLAFYRDRKSFNANSVIDTLAMMGSSRIGCLSIVSQGETPLYDIGSPVYELEKAEAAAQQIDDLNFSEIQLDEMSLLYLANSGTGVGGARPKALVYDQDSAYIAKFNRLKQDSYNNAKVELACLNMARAAGIDIGSGRIKTGINGREVILLERFDIAEAQSRNHVISINALLKEPQSQRDHGFTFRYDNVFRLLQQHSIDIETDLIQLVTLMLFNRAINNIDDHERNFSLINKGDGYGLAPAYDLVPAVILGQYHAAGFGYQPYPPKPSEVCSVGKIFGLPKTRIAQCAERVSDAVRQWRDFAGRAGVDEEESRLIEKYFNL